MKKLKLLICLSVLIAIGIIAWILIHKDRIVYRSSNLETVTNADTVVLNTINWTSQDQYYSSKWASLGVKDFSFTLPLFKKYPRGSHKSFTAFPNADGTLFAAAPQPENFNEIIIFSSDLKNIKEFPMPVETRSRAIYMRWVGEQLFVSFLSDDTGDGTPYLYMLHPTQGFHKIKSYPEYLNFNDSFLGHTKTTSDVSPKLQSSSIFALKVCTDGYAIITLNGTGPWVCTKTAILVSNYSVIKEIFVKETKNDFDIGWSEDNLYIRERQSAYSKPFTEQISKIPITEDFFK